MRARRPADRLLALALVLTCSAAAGATEIPIPDRGPGTPADAAPGARETLAAWLGHVAGRTPPLVSTLAEALSRRHPRGITVDPATGELLLLDPSPYAATLPPVRFALPAVGADARTTAFAITVDTFTASGLGEIASAGMATSAAATGTRFDHVAADRNPIRLEGSFGDEILGQVRHVPEPGTLALFAAGMAGLVGLVLRRRRRRRAVI